MQPKGREFEPRTLHVQGPGAMPGPSLIEPSTVGARVTRLHRLVVLAAAALVLAVTASEALGHVRLVSSSPARAESLARPPDILRLVFSEPVQPSLTSVVLVGPRGDTVMISAPRLEARSDRHIVADVIARLEPGDYVLTWRTVSLDGHPVSGQIPFLVQASALDEVPRDPELAPPDTIAAPHAVVETPPTGFHVLSPAFVAIRWLGYLGVLGVFGAVAFMLLVLPATAAADPAWVESVQEASWRARRWGVMAALMFLLAAVARLVAQGAAVAGPVGVDIGVINAIVLESAWGRAWLIQMVSGGLLLALLTAGERRWARFGTLALLPLLAASMGAAGHALSAPWPPAVVVSAHAVHLMGAGVWLGSLFMLLVAGLPAARSSGSGTSARMTTMVSVFSPLGLACGALVVMTGVVSAAAHLGSIRAIWATDYGRVLILKLGIVAVVAGLGGYNWLRMRPGLASSREGKPLRVAGGFELAFAVLVLLVTAVLVATRPPT